MSSTVFPPALGEHVMMPGDPEIACARRRTKDGIPLDDTVLGRACFLGDRTTRSST